MLCTSDASATPERSIRWPPASCRWHAAAPRDSCGSSSRSDKDYEATIRFGVSTDSYDITGTETSRSDRVPTRDAVEAALASLRGEYLQVPPAFSAKKVAGERAYARARRDETVTLQPVPVRVPRADLLEFSGASARIHVTCSAGFYVRSFAHALGELVGTGACLESLRRTRSGEFTIESSRRARARAGNRAWQ